MESQPNILAGDCHNEIQRANLDGTGVENVVVDLNTPTTMSIDLVARRIYWTDSEWTGQVNRVQAANLDGSNVTEVISGGFPFGVAVDAGVRVDLIKAVKPAFSNLHIGTNYQLQVSADLSSWTNHGAPFTATNTRFVYPQYWDVDNWDQLFFRVQVDP
jgi:hypothetical protein